MFRSDRTMKTKPKPRALRMFANYYPAEDGCVCLHRTRTRANSMANDGCSHAAIPVAVIPLDDAGALVRCAYEASRIPGFDGFAQMTAALAAIGVLPKQKKGGRK